jgi:hypothetical protein
MHKICAHAQNSPQSDAAAVFTRRNFAKSLIHIGFDFLPLSHAAPRKALIFKGL